MKKITLIATALLLTACAETSSTSGTVVDPLLGKTLTTGNNTVLILNADGTIGGQDDQGNTIVGTYTANAAEICSTLTAPARFAGERCSVPVFEGDTVIFNRRDASQSPPYTIQG